MPQTEHPPDLIELGKKPQKIKDRLTETNECLELLMSQNGIEGDGFRQRVREVITLNNLELKY